MYSPYCPLFTSRGWLGAKTGSGPLEVHSRFEEDEKLREGIKLADGITTPAKVKRIRKTENNSCLEITIHEGKKL